MYFAPPSREQATIVSAGASAPVPSRFAAMLQSSAAKRLFSSSVIPGTGVATVEVSVGFATPEAQSLITIEENSA